jgi:NADPH:quinone reductase-like Zn-dependent oxidoreductase
MKASVNLKYGSPDVLHLMEIDQPIPKNDEVLVKIHATSVNRTDCGFRKPEYLIVRLISGLFKPKRKVLGSEFSGEIVTIGKNVTQFKPGDAVFGLNTFKFGTHAEYICIKENGSIALKPSNMTFQEAAAVCDGLMLAINYIRNIDFTKNKKILINGASGSIGSASVQLAKYYGGEVTAVTNTKSIELVLALGATQCIDYTKEDFTKREEVFDVILDAVGKSSYYKCKKILKSGGVYYSSELGFLAQNIFLALWTPIFSRKKVKFPLPKDNQKDILFFKELIEAGHFRAVIDKTYPLEQIVEATKYVETGEKTGNVVIQIS